MSKRSRKKKSRCLPPLLTHLIWAAKQVREDAGGADISHIPEALKEFGAMAQWGVPAHGAFVATQEDIELIIHRVARVRFGGGDAKREFDKAVRIVEELTVSTQRVRIEQVPPSVRRSPRSPSPRSTSSMSLCSCSHRMGVRPRDRHDRKAASNPQPDQRLALDVRGRPRVD